MKKLALSTLLFFQFFLSYSQVDSLSALHNVFTPLNRSNIPSGILSDYGVQFVSFAPFNGILTDSSYTDFDVWQMLYAGLTSSVIDTAITLEGVNSIVTRLKATFKADSNTVYIPIMNFDYASLNPDAYTLGLINVVNEQLYDIAGKNPYVKNTLFAAAPSRTYANGPTVKFCLRSDMYLNNQTASVSSIYIDFGNGTGYKRVYFGTPYIANYTSSDTVTINVKVSLSNSIVLYSHFKMYIEVPSPEKYDDWNIQTVQLPKISGVHSGGTLSWVLSDSNKTGKIRKPLIIAEGFDPLAIMFNKNYNIYRFFKDINRINPTDSDSSLLENFNNKEYDIVFLDYTDGVDDIFRNARLLEQAIDSVNRWKSGVAGAEPNVVMGISMGGLVAKTALRSMELAGRSHDTRLFISMDSPHKGANIPVGYQAMLRHLADLKIVIYVPFPIEVYNVGDRVDIIGSAVKVLNSKAARQMLTYRVTLSDKSLVYDNTTHEAFQQQYDATGFPTLCRNVAVSNGSISGISTFGPGEDIFDLYKKKSINYFWSLASFLTVFTNHGELACFPFITYNSDIIMDFNVKGTPSCSVAKVYDGRISVKKRILYFITREVTLTHKTLNSTQSMLPYDGAPGSTSGFSKDDLEDISEEYRDLMDESIKQPLFTFIPLASSLAVSSSLPLSRLDNQNIIATGKTPFSNYFAQHGNENHTLFTPKNARYILDELSGNSCPTPAGFTINGSNKLCVAETYTTSYLNPCATYTWSCSKNLTIKDGQGTASATFQKLSQGSGSVNCTISNTSGSFTSSKSSISVGVAKPNVVGPFQDGVRVFAPCVGKTVTYKVYPETPGISTYKWRLYGNDFIEIFPSRSYATFGVSEEKIYTLTTEQYDSQCGWSGMVSTAVYGTLCENQFSVSPNPASSEITISTVASTSQMLKSAASGENDKTAICSVRIFDQQGNMVFSESYQGSSNATVNTGSLRKGIYIVVVNGKEKHTVIKE